MMTDIAILLERRNARFEGHTKAIFKQIDSSLDGVRDYLISADPSYIPGIFYWEDISIIEDLVILTGIVRYKAGDTFVLDADTIVITEDNKDYFNRALRIGIPLSIVNQYRAASVTEFLETVHGTMEDEAMLDSADLFDETIDPKPIENFEFNLDDLSEDQRKALSLHTDSEKIN